VRAAVTEDVGIMRLRERPEPEAPAPGTVVVRPEAVGLCGSDYHLFSGHLAAETGAALPRVQGHEVSAAIEAVGAGCRPELAVGVRVAIYPLSSCGRCYPCRVGRPNACDNFTLIGIHVDGGLQERLGLAQAQVFPIDAPAPIATLAEPVSIAVRAVNRGRIASGERVVVLGAGPIGQSVCLVARDRGAEVLVVDRVASRLGLSERMGARTLEWRDADAVIDAARSWSGGEGPPVVVDATGAPPAIRAAVDMVASAGRVVQVGMSGAEVSLRVGSFTEKELDMVGVSCCNAEEFADAVDLVERHRDLLADLITHEYPLDEAPQAIAYAMEHPTEVLKAVIRGA
jgi:threonine dehydrogenase-like Zn-dependent dehydrogenase